MEEKKLSYSAPIDKRKNRKISGKILSMFPNLVRGWNNLTISRKLAFQFAVNVIIFFTIILTSLNITANTYDSINEYNDFSENVTENIIGIISTLNNMEFLSQNMINTDETRRALNIYIEISEKEKTVLMDLYRLENTFIGDRDKVVQLRNSIIAVQEIYNHMANDVLGKQHNHLNELQSRAGYMLNNVNRQIQDILLISERIDNSIFLEAERDYDVQRLFLMASGIAAVLLLSVFMYYVGLSIYAPLEEFAIEIRKAKNPTHNPVLDTERKDEIGYISKEFKQMIEFVRESNRKILDLEAMARNNQKMESLGVMASGIAHEINNPINGIMGYSELIKDMSNQGTDLYNYSNEIIREVNRVSYIVQNLLHFSRHKYSTRTRASLRDIIDRSLSLVRFLIKKDFIEIKVDIEDELPDIMCSEQEIEQIFINLVMNSKDALKEKFGSQQGVKKIQVKCCKFARGGKLWVRTEVFDNGTGISDEVKNQVFDPFFTLKDKNEGTGLGLSITYGIIRKHGGEIFLESTAGEYSRFIFELPVEGNIKGDSNEEND